MYEAASRQPFGIDEAFLSYRDTMKILCVHAHFDDFEFVAAGVFELWRRRLGEELQAKVIVCTDGAGGHHFRTREETAAVRLREQEESARIGGYAFERLCAPDGAPFRGGWPVPTKDFLAALWKAIRDFEPDYLFCPPLPTDSLVGIHTDHVNVAEAVRRVAYFINVPHAYTPEYPTDERHSVPCKVPVILNVSDSYMATARSFDLAVDVELAFDRIAAMSWCHQSQIVEWLPWVGRHDMQVASSLEEWKKQLRARIRSGNRRLGIRSSHVFEVFTVTAWGAVPDYATLVKDIPGLSQRQSRLGPLRRRLQCWRG